MAMRDLIQFRRGFRRCSLGSFLMTLCIAFVGMNVTPAQAFTSGSNGSDGALNITLANNGAEFEFDPTAFNPPLDQDGDGVYHFTTIAVEAGVTVRFSGRRANRPVIWLATGAVQIAGILDLNGENGLVGLVSNNGGPGRRPSDPGPGGFSGGAGGNSLQNIGTAGLGPGGAVPNFAGSGGGGGYTDPGGPASFGSNPGGSAYGNTFLFPLIGGSGGGGGAGMTTHSGGAGGAGGGAILIASSTSISVGGVIRANGGSGGNAAAGSPGCCGFAGGGGSGGAIQLIAATISGAGTLSASGGARGVDPSSYLGGFGASGRIRLEASQRVWTFALDPSPTIATPVQVHLGNAPTVRAMGITDSGGTHPVPAKPSGSFEMPDVTIGDSLPVTVQIQARYVAVGTVVRLHVISEGGSDQVIDSTPLSGSTASSTATATVTLPSGHSRAFLETTWSP